MNLVRLLMAPILAIVMFASVLHAHAQGYPGATVHLIVGFTPGSAVDIVARTVSQKLGELWGQRVLVENRPGAGGSVGAGAVAKSAANGHTLLVHTNAFASNPALYSNLQFDPLKDFIAISPLAAQPFVIVVASGSGLKTLSDLIASAKSRPGQLNYGSAGIGGATHFAAEKFRLAAGIDLIHVPNKGGPEANADVLAGRVTYWFAPVTTAISLLRDGRLVALGVSSPQRSILLPQVPTIAEAGLPGFEETAWFGLWAPAATPAGVVDKLARDVAQALGAPDLRERLNNLGAEPMIMSPADFARFVRAELEAAVRVVKAAGIKVE